MVVGEEVDSWQDKLESESLIYKCTLLFVQWNTYSTVVQVTVTSLPGGLVCRPIPSVTIVGIVIIISPVSVPLPR